MREKVKMSNRRRIETLLWTVEGQLQAMPAWQQPFFAAGEDHTSLYREVRFGQWPDEQDRAEYVAEAIGHFQKRKAQALGGGVAVDTVRLVNVLPPENADRPLEPTDEQMGLVGQPGGGRQQVQTQLVDVTAAPMAVGGALSEATQSIRQMNGAMGAADKARVGCILWFKEAGVRPHDGWNAPISRRFITQRGGRHVQDNVHAAMEHFMTRKARRWVGVLPPGNHFPPEPAPNAPISQPP